MVTDSVGASGHGAATGRFDTTQSAVTGKLLSYFTPYPLQDLLQWARERPVKPSCGEDDLALVMLLIRPAAIHAPTNSFDDRQAARLGRISLGHVEYKTPSALIELGAAISPRLPGLREEIVFAGGVNASNASHVFAPHEVLQSHIQRLAETLTELPSGIDSTAAASVAGFYGAHLHPYIDGNGRWARLLATYVGARSGSASSGLISAVYQAYCKVELTRVFWPRARSSGLDCYLDAGAAFEDTLRARLADSDALLAVREIVCVLRRYAPSRRIHEQFLIQFFAGDGSAIMTAKEELGLSSRRLEGLTREMQKISSNLITAPGSADLMGWLSNDTVRYVTEARDRVLGEFT